MGDPRLSRHKKLANDSARSPHENGTTKGPSKESERWLLSVVQNTSDVFTVVDAEGTVRYISPSIEEVLGYQPQERVGRSCFDLLHPDDLPRAKSTFVEALQRPGHTLALGVRIRHRDDYWRQVEVTGTNLLDDETIRGIVINWRDVTDHKRAEEALRESEQRFGSAFRDAAIGMALVGTDGRFRQVNRSLCEILGYSEEELLGKPSRR
jgi:PAS domain S-box-containing protein